MESPPFIRKGGGSLGFQNFPIKREGKFLKDCSKRKRGITNKYELTLSKVIFLCVWYVRLAVYTISISICISQEGLLNLISRYMASASKQFLKSEDIFDLCKVNFCIRKSFIQCFTGSCSMHITDCRNVDLYYLYICNSVLVAVCPVRDCLCVWYQI